MINRVVLMGRLCAETEQRKKSSRHKVCNLSIAVQRNYAPQGGERATDFINIVVWRQQAKFVSNYFHKGNMIAIDGRIETRSYTDRNNQKRTAFEVVADNVSFVESKASASASAGNSFGGGNSFAGNAAPSYEQSQPVPAGNMSQQPASNFSSGDFGDFQEIDSDEDLPF